MSASQAILKDAIKQLMREWDYTRQFWDDKVSAEIEQTYLLPLEAKVRSVIHAMDQINETAGRAKRACEG